MSKFEFDFDGYEKELADRLRESGDAFRGKYKHELNQLAGLSRSVIDRITPDATDLAIYDALIQVVKDASRKNLSQAELKANVSKLGEIGIQIAKKVGVGAFASFA